MKTLEKDEKSWEKHGGVPKIAHISVDYSPRLPKLVLN